MAPTARLSFTGLIALSLTLHTLPAQATSWTATIQDVMNLVYCLVGLAPCEGFQPGADTIDITVDNPNCTWDTQCWNGTMCMAHPDIDALEQAAFDAGVASVDVTADNEAIC
jgi:hypothetical protein